MIDRTTTTSLVLAPTRRLRRFAPAQRQLASNLLPYALVVLLYLAGGALIDGFMTWPNARSLLVLASFLGIASIGQTLAVMIGGIDLSIPAVIGLGNVITIQLYGQGWPFAAVVAIVVAGGLLVGFVNGAVSQILRAHPLIVTLANGSIVGGVVLIIGQGNSVGNVPSWLTQAVSPGGRTLGVGVPGAVLLWAGLTLAVVFLQRRTRVGRLIYAVGANAVAARLALVRPFRIWVVVYMLSGLFAAITGILLAGFSSGADPSIGDPYLFLTLAAVVVGGTSLLGGSGGYGRTVVGALAINILTAILIGEGYTDNVQQLLLGILIILLVALYGRQLHVRDQV